MSLTSNMRSKLVDGILSFVAIFLLMGVFIVLMKPFSALGSWGMWAYLVLMFVGGIGALWLSIQERFGDIALAWFGIFGGMCAWSVTEMGGELGLVSIEDWDGIVLFLLTVATTAVLWRFFPIGPKFWFIVLFLNWGGHILIKIQRYLFSGQPIGETVFSLQTTHSLTVAAMLIIMGGMLYWIFMGASTRAQRLWGAVFLWNAVSITFFILR